MPATKRRSTFSKQTGRRVRRRQRYVRRRKYGTRGKVAGIARRVAMSLAEKKEYSQKFQSLESGTVGGLFHNVLKEDRLIDNNTTGQGLLPAQGDGDRQRVGNAIYTTGIMVRGTMAVAHDRRNTTVKIWLLEYNSSQGDPTSYSTFFNNTSGNGLLDNVNPNFFRAKLVGTYRLTARDLLDTSNDGNIHFKKWIPFRRKLEFSSNGTTIATKGMKETLSLVYLAYDTYNASSSDRCIRNLDTCRTLHYKDP